MGPVLTDFSLLTCPYLVPDRSVPIEKTISRWAYAKFPHPAIIVYPRTEFDIASAVAFSKHHGLHILPACGAHASFISITPSTLYLDLSNYNSMAIDKHDQSITFGGGVVAGDLIRKLATDGFYTTIPDSNSVGVVGALLGGGTSQLTGIHGLMVDNVISFKIITWDGYILDISASSTGEELSLFNALCGAGQGLGAVVSAKMKIYPISNLSLTEDKVWTRRLIFPASAIDTAIEAFLSTQPVPAPLVTHLLFTNSVPGEPTSGEPFIVLSAWYFGPAEEAQQVTSTLFETRFTEKVLRIIMNLIPLSSINNERAPIDAHVGYKTMVAGRLTKHSASSILNSFKVWEEMTRKFPDAAGSIAYFTTLNPQKARDIGLSPEGRDKLVELGNRERGATVSVITFCRTEETMTKLKGFGQRLVNLNRGYNRDMPRTLPNNMTAETKIDEVLSETKLMALKRTKRVWDPKGVFWSPYLQSKE